MNRMITILGPTACGKTSLAVAVAQALPPTPQGTCGGEILSADSRQVYRRMDIGTGKDLAEYQGVPYHLIDICEPGTKYNLFQYQQDFFNAYQEIRKRGAQPILCGGTGLYIEAVLRGYQLSPVPQNPQLRARLEGKTLQELTQMLTELKAQNGSTMHNTTDVDTAQRAIRAIEIESYQQTHNLQTHPQPLPEGRGAYSFAAEKNNESTIGKSICPPPSQGEDGGGSAGPAGGGSPSSLVFGLSIPRDLRRQRITQRLKARLDEGMADEVRSLLAEGIAPDDLLYYGLEYKYVTEYVLGRTTFDEMFSRLEIAIHQFAKRQMTWFRGMERRGITIHWIDATLPLEEKVHQILCATTC